MWSEWPSLVSFRYIIAVFRSDSWGETLVFTRTKSAKNWPRTGVPNMQITHVLKTSSKWLFKSLSLSFFEWVVLDAFFGQFCPILFGCKSMSLPGHLLWHIHGKFFTELPLYQKFILLIFGVSLCTHFFYKQLDCWPAEPQIFKNHSNFWASNRTFFTLLNLFSEILSNFQRFCLILLFFP